MHYWFFEKNVTFNRRVEKNKRVCLEIVWFFTVYIDGDCEDWIIYSQYVCLLKYLTIWMKLATKN